MFIKNEPDYINEENQAIKSFLEYELDLFLEFQLKHDVQITRGEDFQYECRINSKIYSTSLTPLGALLYGIYHYIETHK